MVPLTTFTFIVNVDYTMISSTAFKRTFALRSIFRYYSTPSSATSAAAGTSKVVSSVAAGTDLKLDLYKTKAPPVALEDSEYPAWLWDIMDPVAQQAKLDANPMLKARKERRKLNKEKIRNNNFLAAMEK